MSQQQTQPEMMNAALTKAAQRGFPGLAGSKGFRGGKPGKNSPQFKPVRSKPAKSMPKVARPKAVTKGTLVKTRSQMATPKTPAEKALMQPSRKSPSLNRVRSSVRKSMGYA